MTGIDALYTKARGRLSDATRRATPYSRRVIRFFALPYAYFFLVNWEECRASRLRVFLDFLYIFFVLKDYPDYYSVFRLWEKDRSEWPFYYGSTYNPHQRSRLQREVQRPEYEIVFEDKLVSDFMCRAAGLPVPKMLLYLEPHSDYRGAIARVLGDADAGRLIIKEARGVGGRNVFLVSKLGRDITVRGARGDLPLRDFRLEHPSVVQEVVAQHPELSAVAPSVNTVRTESLLTRDGDVLILGATMRFGLRGNFVDNVSAGGLSIGVNSDTGQLHQLAADSLGNRYSTHPDSGIAFAGVTVPFWTQLLELTVRIQQSFPFFKLLGPDIAVTPNGPVIIEINAIPDHAAFEGGCGPVFRNRRVWEEFNRYDLLINKPSKELYL